MSPRVSHIVIKNFTNVSKNFKVIETEIDIIWLNIGVLGSVQVIEFQRNFEAIEA